MSPPYVYRYIGCMDLGPVWDYVGPFAPLLWYAVCCVTGHQLWPGEESRLRQWAHTGTVRIPRRQQFKLFRYFDDGVCRMTELDTASVLGTASATISVAKWYKGDGNPFIVINYDHYQGSWIVGLRLRRLVEHIAAREGVPAFPIPFTPFYHVHQSSCRLGMELIERRGRECVFAAKLGAGKTKYYLSGYDSNEASLWNRRGLYFLTRLPREVTSIADARKALKPASVVMAEKLGRRVYRQGDMFAIQSRITDDDVVAAGGEIAQHVPLYGTAHTAEWVATLPDGTQFAWGKLLHRPDLIGPRRRPDHRDVPLKRDDTWYVVAKNTTPMAPPKMGREVNII